MSSFPRILLGVVSLICALGFIVGIPLISGQSNNGGIWIAGAFCGIVSLACFEPRTRIVTVRIIAAVIFLVCVGYVYSQIGGPFYSPSSSTHLLNAIIAFIFFGFPAAYFAIFGPKPLWKTSFFMEVLGPRLGINIRRMDVYEQADLYCAAFNWPLDDEVDWLVETFGRPRNVLEPFCGNARYGPVFADRGVKYVGFDLSESMLALAPDDDRITLYQADARDYAIDNPPSEGFDLAWCAVNSICHLTDERDIISHLRCIHRDLAPTGVYILELQLFRHDGPWLDPPGTRNSWKMPQEDGSVVHTVWARLSCDLALRTSSERATIHQEYQSRILTSVEHEYTMRMWTHDDLLRLAGDAGFRVEPRVWLHKGTPPFEEVPLTAELEQSGMNLYLALRPSNK